MRNEWVRQLPQYFKFKMPQISSKFQAKFCRERKTCVILCVTDGVSPVWLTPPSHPVLGCVTLRPYARLTWPHMVLEGPFVPLMDSAYSLFKKASYGPKERA